MITSRVCQNRNVPGAHEAGQALGEPAERLRVDVDGEPAGAARLVQPAAGGVSHRQLLGPTGEPHRRLRRPAPGGACRTAVGFRVGLSGGQSLVPPVVGQQVIQHVVHRHRAEQVVLVVDDGRAHQVVGREEPGDLGQRGIRRQRAPSRCPARRPPARTAARAAAAGCARSPGSARSGWPAAGGRRTPSRPVRASGRGSGSGPALRRWWRPG